MEAPDKPIEPLPICETNKPPTEAASQNLIFFAIGRARRQDEPEALAGYVAGHKYHSIAER
jgi:hypothetical protein